MARDTENLTVSTVAWLIDRGKGLPGTALLAVTPYSPYRLTNRST